MSDLVTRAQLQDFLGIDVDATDTVEGRNLDFAIAAASLAIQRACNRSFEVATGTPTARIFTAEREGSGVEVEVDDFMTVTGLVVKYRTYLEDPNTFSYTQSDAYWTKPYNAASRSMPWTEIRFEPKTYLPLAEAQVQITADWGWTAVPDTIKFACMLQAARFFKRKDAPFGILGAYDVGGGTRLFDRLDPDVMILCGNFKRRWV
ncbi:MAG: hypothetical protein WB239_11150 [Acidimicrobiia bacterium]